MTCAVENVITGRGPKLLGCWSGTEVKVPRKVINDILILNNGKGVL